MKYYFSKETTVVDPEGKTVELSMLRPTCRSVTLT